MAKRIFKALGTLLLVIVLAAVGLLAFLTITEFRPADTENTAIADGTKQRLEMGDTFSVMTWNVGYGALGDNADFFMDGGEMVRSATEARLNKNLKGMAKELMYVDPDMVLLQEVDLDSTRSYHVDECDRLADALPETDVSKALYYSVKFVPYPAPPIGEVHTNLETLSKYDVTHSTRIQLPVPFAWPVRTANLKRCLLVTRLPIEDSDKQLVLVNLHLEAYDDGEGKEAQTKILYTFMEKEVQKGNYVIAAGDFNQSFSNIDTSMYPYQEGMWAIGELDADVFDEDFQVVMDNTVPTCRSLDKPLAGANAKTFQYYMIDGFIASKNITIKSVKTRDLGFRHSDHNPVVLTAVLN